jgi:GAF domain-containing protein
LTLFLVLAMWMTLSIGTLLIGTRSVWPLSVLIILGVLRLALVIETANGLQVAFFVILLFALVIQLGLTWLQARGQNDTVQRLSLDAAQRLNTYEVIYSLTQRVAQRPEMNSLLPDIVRLVRDSSVEIEAVQLWLVMEDRRNVTLSASTERADPIGRQVGIGSLDIVGRVTLDGKAVLVQNTPNEQSYRRSALPPGIQSQLAMPLKIVSEVNGVLLVTSRQNDAFLGADGQSLQKLADQAAVAIENTRLYANVQADQLESRRLTDELRAAQKSIERLNRQLTGQAWSDYLRGRDQTLAYTIDLQSGQVDNFSDWTASLNAARQSSEVTIQTIPGQTENVLALPISVRGQAIGALEFEIDPDHMPSPEQIAVMQQVVERMGLSAENARLFDEAQRLARRENMLSVIGARLQSAASIDSVLMAAAQSLSESLNASRIAIRLADPDNTPDIPPVDRNPNQEAAR